MSVSDRELDRLRDEYQERQQAARDAKEQFEAVLHRRDELEREAERLTAQIERLEDEAAADALLQDPGGGTAVASEVRTEKQRLAGRKGELETRIESRRMTKERADEATREAALEVARALRERRTAVAVEYRKRLEAIGKSVVGPYRAHLDARDELAALDRELKAAAGQATTSPAQLQRLRRAIQRGDRDLSGSALLGWCVVEALRWARRFEDSSLGEYLREEGVPAIDGSPRHGNPFGALEDVVAALESGRLPGGSTQL